MSSIGRLVMNTSIKMDLQGVRHCSDLVAEITKRQSPIHLNKSRNKILELPKVMTWHRFFFASTPTIAPNNESQMNSRHG